MIPNPVPHHAPAFPPFFFGPHTFCDVHQCRKTHPRITGPPASLPQQPLTCAPASPLPPSTTAITATTTISTISTISTAPTISTISTISTAPTISTISAAPSAVSHVVRVRVEILGLSAAFRVVHVGHGVPLRGVSRGRDGECEGEEKDENCGFHGWNFFPVMLLGVTWVV
ncbi:hypothetical protein VTK56DRAFT_3256 [Thermocarpiscus australiensis]